MSHSLSLLLAPFALLLPSAAGSTGGDARLAPDGSAGPVELPGPAAGVVLAADELLRDPQQNQVRIEQRMVIRIAPAPPAQRDLPRTLPREGLREVRFKGCVDIDGIVGIQPANDNRLVLFLRDRQMLSIELERSCNARDFYSGAYIERNRDGRLCSRRERLQSRTGADCEISQLHRLVEVRD